MKEGQEGQWSNKIVLRSFAKLCLQHKYNTNIRRVA